MPFSVFFSLASLPNERYNKTMESANAYGICPFQRVKECREG